MHCPACGARNEGSSTVCATCGIPLGAQETEVAPAPLHTPAPGPDIKPGTLFHGRYEIEGPLGRGGMGMVYRAHDRTLDEGVAIKVLRPELADDATMAERFKSEIKLARKVRHRNVCAIHDFGEDRGVLYISMELIDGVDLKRMLRERGPLPAEEAYDVAIQVAEGLEAVHAAGIIHRDLKTSNVVLDKAGVARLMDFGIAKRQEQSGSLTGTGLVLGTPEYMSPEQAQGRRVDVRTDVYALGVVTYELFAGDVPFRGETPIATILMQVNDAPPLEGAFLPDSLRPLLRKALAKEPGARYPSAAAMAEALRAARTSKFVAAPTEVLTLASPDPPSTGPQPAHPSLTVRPSLTARPSATPRRPPARRVWPWLAGLAALAAGALGFALRPSFVASPPPGPAVTALPAPATLAPPATTVGIAASAVAPDPTAAAARLSSAPPSTLHGRATPARERAPSPGPLAAAPTAPLSSVAPVPAPGGPPETASAEPGQLQLAVRPWAEVDLDGRTLGTTPLDRVSLSPGSHRVVLRHPSYDPFSRAVTIRPGELTRLLVDLPREGTPRRD